MRLESGDIAVKLDYQFLYEMFLRIVIEDDEISSALAHVAKQRGFHIDLEIFDCLLYSINSHQSGLEDFADFLKNLSRDGLMEE